VELAQSQFAFDPGVAELDDPALAAILLLGLGRGHLAAEGDHGRSFFCAQQAAPTMLIARTALRLQRATLTILRPSFVAVEKFRWEHNHVRPHEALAMGELQRALARRRT